MSLPDARDRAEAFLRAGLRMTSTDPGYAKALYATEQLIQGVVLDTRHGLLAAIQEVRRTNRGNRKLLEALDDLEAEAKGDQHNPRAAGESATTDEAPAKGADHEEVSA